MLSSGVLVAGKYRVIAKLGEGAMGSVWLARNEVTEREFAIKVLLPQAAASPNAVARFLREAKVCGALRHPSILEIYDAGRAPEIDQAPYLVMERLDGATIDLVLRKRGALTVRVALDVVAQISRGLFLAHEKGIIHRDLKPANVFLHRPGTGALEPKVLDFGISKIVDRAAPQIALTTTAAVLGSPLYMSPEQMSGNVEIDARSDVHALGVLLWECLTGNPPFLAQSYNLLVVEIMTGPRPKLRDVMPSASPELASILDRSFAIDPRHRFASAAAFADALEAQLALLGGSVLGLRTAAIDVLGSLDLSSKPPPSPRTSTTGALSVDPAQTDKTQLSAASPGKYSQSPMAHSAPLTGPRSSATSFAETEAAHGTEPRTRRAAAVSSAGGQLPRPGRSTRIVGVVGVSLALAIGVAFAAAKYRAGAPGAAASGVAATAPSEPVAITAVPSAPPAPMPSIAPAAAASAPATPASPPMAASASPAAARTPPAPKRPATHSNPPAPTARPRVDQSGL